MSFKVLQPGIGKYAGTGVHYVPARGVPWGVHEVSLYAGASPPVAKSDTGVVPAVTSPDNFTLTLTSSGVPVIQSNGSTARQIIALDVYDWSLRRWYGRVTDYVNDQPPVMLDLAHHAFTYPVGVPIIDLNLATFVTDPNGDQVTITTGNPLPPGLTIAANVLTGTPAQLGTFSVTFTASDAIVQGTQFPSWTFIIQPNQVIVPTSQWSADSSLILGSGSVQIAPPPGSRYVWTADGAISLELLTAPTTAGPPGGGSVDAYMAAPVPSAVLLAWRAVAGAASYNVYRNGALLANVAALQYTATGLAYNTLYEFNVTTVIGGQEFQNGWIILRFSSPDPTVTLMPRKIPFPSVGWN